MFHHLKITKCTRYDTRQNILQKRNFSHRYIYTSHYDTLLHAFKEITSFLHRTITSYNFLATTYHALTNFSGPCTIRENRTREREREPLTHLIFPSPHTSSRARHSSKLLSHQSFISLSLSLPPRVYIHVHTHIPTRGHVYRRAERRWWQQTAIRARAASSCWFCDAGARVDRRVCLTWKSIVDSQYLKWARARTRRGECRHRNCFLASRDWSRRIRAGEREREREEIERLRELLRYSRDVSPPAAEHRGAIMTFCASPGSRRRYYASRWLSPSLTRARARRQIPRVCLLLRLGRDMVARGCRVGYRGEFILPGSVSR